MPKFYMHFQHSELLAEDTEGQDLPSIADAEAAAIRSAREILADGVKYASKEPLEYIIIANEDGQELRRISAKDILPPPLG